MQYEYFSCEKCQVHLYPSYYLINKRACLGIRDSIRHLWESEVSRQAMTMRFSHLHPTRMDLWWSHQDVIAVSCGFEDFKQSSCVGQLSPVYLQGPSRVVFLASCSFLSQSEGFLQDVDWSLAQDTVDFKIKHQPDLFNQDVNSHLKHTWSCRPLYKSLIFIFWSSVY